jgi:hypothetical protein
MIINSELSSGDRIVLLDMVEESLTPLTRGVVSDIQNTPFGIVYSVSWDNGSKLSLLPDVDKWVKEEDYLKMVNRRG